MRQTPSDARYGATAFLAAGYNFRRILAWLAALWRALIMAVLANASDAAITRSATPDRSNEPLPAANAAYFTVDEILAFCDQHSAAQ